MTNAMSAALGGGSNEPTFTAWACSELLRTVIMLTKTRLGKGIETNKKYSGGTETKTKTVSPSSASR